jgi:hypothetical protein
MKSMEKIKLNTSKLQLNRERIANLTTQEAQELHGEVFYTAGPATGPTGYILCCSTDFVCKAGNPEQELALVS